MRTRLRAVSACLAGAGVSLLVVFITSSSQQGSGSPPAGHSSRALPAEIASAGHLAQAALRKLGDAVPPTPVPYQLLQPQTLSGLVGAGVVAAGAPALRNSGAAQGSEGRPRLHREPFLEREAAGALAPQGEPPSPGSRPEQQQAFSSSTGGGMAPLTRTAAPGNPKAPGHQPQGGLLAAGAAGRLLSRPWVRPAVSRLWGAVGQAYPPGDTKPPLKGPVSLPGVSSEDTCGQALNIPKVAMLFLTRAELFHEPTWALWFQRAAGQLPLELLRGGPCREGNCPGNATALRAALRACGLAPQGAGVLQSQHLFSVHVHPLPDYPGFPNASIFHGREISNRVQVEWGTHELVTAARNLLTEDPRNQKFLLLSESGLPLYSPLTVWRQLISEDLSRMDSCGSGRVDGWRYSERMGEEVAAHWRKSSQWFAITRKHAQLIVDDTTMIEPFKTHCRNAWDKDYDRWRDCFSDEHYFPSLIAYLKLGHETDCRGWLVNVDWSRGGSHPRTYSPWNINERLIQRLRNPGESCRPEQAQTSAESSFTTLAALGLVEQGGGSSAATAAANSLQLAAEAANTLRLPEAAFNATALTYDCPLFARKFPREVVNVAYTLWGKCETSLRITNDGACEDSRRLQREQRVQREEPSLNRRVLGLAAEKAWESALDKEDDGWL